MQCRVHIYRVHRPLLPCQPDSVLGASGPHPSLRGLSFSPGCCAPLPTLQSESPRSRKPPVSSVSLVSGAVSACKVAGLSLVFFLEVGEQRGERVEMRLRLCPLGVSRAVRWGHTRAPELWMRGCGLGADAGLRAGCGCGSSVRIPPTAGPGVWGAASPGRQPGSGPGRTALRSRETDPSRP